MGSEWLRSSNKSGTAEDFSLCLLIGDRGFFVASTHTEEIPSCEIPRKRDKTRFAGFTRYRGSRQGFVQARNFGSPIA